MYACMYMYVYVCICMYMYICIHVYMYVYVCICMCVYIYICVCVHYIYIYMHIHVYECIYVYTSRLCCHRCTYGNAAQSSTGASNVALSSKMMERILSADDKYAARVCVCVCVCVRACMLLCGVFENLSYHRGRNMVSSCACMRVQIDVMRAREYE